MLKFECLGWGDCIGEAVRDRGGVGKSVSRSMCMGEGPVCIGISRGNKPAMAISDAGGAVRDPDWGFQGPMSSQWHKLTGIGLCRSLLVLVAESRWWRQGE